MSLKLTSPSFEERGEIPLRHTCDGEDLSPALAWSDAPKGTRSFALIVDDPDAPDPEAPKTVWVHWVVFNLPVETSQLSENVQELPSGAGVGLNDWGRAEYGGPCPPRGRHRYFHKLYALDTVFSDLQKPKKADLERAMKGHILDSTELVGTYQRKR